MSSINKVSILNAENHKEWIRKVDLAFVCVELDWVLKEPQSVQPPKPEGDENDDDDAACDIYHVALKKKKKSLDGSSFSLQSSKNHHSETLSFPLPGQAWL